MDSVVGEVVDVNNKSVDQDPSVSSPSPGDKSHSLRQQEDGEMKKGSMSQDTGTIGGDPIIRLSQPMIPEPKWETPCSSFFQQKGAIDFKSYLSLKQGEKDGIFKHSAAIKIQKAWRGFLIRSNLKLLHAAATKIQAFTRGYFARKQYADILKEKAQMRRMELENKAATKIQAAWRGYWSRKTKLNFAEYKKIQEKNRSLKRSIDTINGLESALLDPNATKSQDSLMAATSKQSLSSGDTNSALSDQSKTIEDLIRESFGELAENMNDGRIAELYGYALGRSGGWDGKDIVKRRSTKPLHVPCADFAMDCLDDLFPEFPSIEGLIRPDAHKVQALKAAIRLLYQQNLQKELEKKQKLHYLLRTKNVPGVYSDIYCNELTEIEKELKQLKFWNPPDRTPLGKKDATNPSRPSWTDRASKSPPLNPPSSVNGEILGEELEGEGDDEYLDGLGENGNIDVRLMMNPNHENSFIRQQQVNTHSFKR